MSRPRMLLALDTSTGVGSVGLARDGEVVAYRLLLQEREHASGLVPQISAVIEDARVDRTEIDGVLVGSGPGSFTGLRVAAATARGLAKGLDVPLWHYSSLAAAAASYGAPISGAPPEISETGPPALDGEAADWPRYVLFDARSDRVYGACYRFLPDRMETLVEPGAATISDILESELPEPVLFCGEGAARHADSIEAAGLRVMGFPAGLPTPHGLLRVHALHPGAPPAGPGSRWEPAYLKGSSAWPPAMAAGRSR